MYGCGKNYFLSDISSQYFNIFWPPHLLPNTFFLYFSPIHPVAFAISSPPYTPNTHHHHHPHPHHSILSTGCQAQIRCLGRELECCPSPRWVGIQEAVFTPRRWNNRTGRGSNWDKKKGGVWREKWVWGHQSLALPEVDTKQTWFVTRNNNCLFSDFIVLQCLFLKVKLSNR